VAHTFVDSKFEHLFNYKNNIPRERMSLVQCRSNKANDAFISLDWAYKV
jgi:hypothetical protein